MFDEIRDITAWLDKANEPSEHEDSMRVLKLVEEAGEAAAAYIGMVGQNPRKGVTHSLDDLIAELADVAIAALCAIQHFTQDIDDTRVALTGKLARIIERADIPRGETIEHVRLTADVVLFSYTETSAPHVLLMRRGWPPFKDHWALPGGHVDPGEDALTAARRELLEETGITTEHLDYADAYAAPGRDPRGRYVTFAYTARTPGLPKPTAADDAAEAVWIPFRDVMADGFPLAFDHREIISDARDLMF